MGLRQEFGCMFQVFGLCHSLQLIQWEEVYVIVDCTLHHTFLRKDGQHFIRTRTNGCMEYLARRLRQFLHPFPHLCELNPCLTGLMIVEGCHFSRQSGRSRSNPSLTGSALASPNDQVVICTILGVQVSSKAKHWSTTFRAQNCP